MLSAGARLPANERVRHHAREPTPTPPRPLPPQLVEDAGFKAVEYENLTAGVVAIHSGFKL